jgi:flagellar biosynthesis protein FlhF
MLETTEQNEREQVHTFRAGSLREALAMVRKALGADALILRQHREGYQVCVDACLELPAAPQPDPEEDKQSVTSSQISAVSVESLVPKQSSPAVDPELLQQLSAVGYKDSVIQALPGCKDLHQFRTALTQRLHYAHKPASALQGVYRFVGTSGVGKSSLIIKLMAQFVRHNPCTTVAVISTDRERLAGTEALQLACQTFAVHMQECRPEELQAAVAKFKNKTLILVDTPAISPARPLMAINGVKDIWVCSALHSQAHLRAQHQQVADLNPAGVAVTQTDLSIEGDALGNLLYELRLPLYWLGTANGLPDGLELADEQSVEQWLFAAPQPQGFAIAV